MSILQLIASDSFLAVNKKLIKELGLHEAILLGAFASKQNYNNNDWFYYTQEAINNDCGLGRKPFEAALNKLIEIGIIITKKEGLPAKKYYLITDKLGELLQTSMSQTDKQACPKRTNTIDKDKNTNIINSTPLPHREFENGQGIYPEREQSQEVNSSAYRNWLKIIKDNNIQFTQDELFTIKLYSEAKPFLPPYTILANLILLITQAEKGLNICDAILNSFQCKSIIPAKLDVVHDSKGNRIYHQAIAKKRLHQIENETKALSQNNVLNCS